jgi:hypothetical protein
MRESEISEADVVSLIRKLSKTDMMNSLEFIEEVHGFAFEIPAMVPETPTSKSAMVRFTRR